MTKMPTTAQELYDLLLQTPDLCGTLTMENLFVLRWDLWEDHYLGIFFSGDDCQISLNKRGALLDCSITHWHPEPENLPEELLSIGRRDCILVLHISPAAISVAYKGPEKDCPRRLRRNGLFQKVLCLKAQ